MRCLCRKVRCDLTDFRPKQARKLLACSMPLHPRRSCLPLVLRAAGPRSAAAGPLAWIPREFSSQLPLPPLHRRAADGMNATWINWYRPRVSTFWRRADALDLSESTYNLSSWVPQVGPSWAAVCLSTSCPPGSACTAVQETSAVQRRLVARCVAGGTRRVARASARVKRVGVPPHGHSLCLQPLLAATAGTALSHPGALPRLSCWLWAQMISTRSR